MGAVATLSLAIMAASVAFGAIVSAAAVAWELYTGRRDFRRAKFSLRSLFYVVTALCIALAARRFMGDPHVDAIILLLTPLWAVMGLVVQILVEDLYSNSLKPSEVKSAAAEGWNRPSVVAVVLVGGFLGWLTVAEFGWGVSLVAAIVLAPLAAALAVVWRIFLQDSAQLSRCEPLPPRGDEPHFTADFQVPPSEAPKPAPRLRFGPPPRGRGSPVASGHAAYYQR